MDGLPDEQIFQQELSILIQRYDSCHPLDLMEDELEKFKPKIDWDNDFDDLLMKVTRDQANRALDLLQLHLQNRWEN
jgi:hypothetical protein